MSDGAKLRLVAVGAALFALVFTLVATIVVLTRNNEPTKPSAKAIAVTDHVVRATDVVRLRRDDVEAVIEQGVAKGLRVKDAELAKALGLADGDVITAISGKPLTREMDSYDAIAKLSLMSATTLYVEVARKDGPALLRWKLDGDLREARYGAKSPVSGVNPLLVPSPVDPLGPSAPSVIDPFASSHGTTPDPTDPLVATIEKVDDTHVRVPRKTVDAFLADPTGMTKGARVVPSVKNGKADGFKLYAIRPSSGYARLGFENGDTIHAVNGVRFTDASSVLDGYTKLRDATSLVFEITRRGQPIELSIEITK